MRALVTGGAGFVGHGVVAALHEAGDTVVVLDPSPPHPRWPRGVAHHRESLLEPPRLREAAEGCDVVFHVAGIWDGGPDGDRVMRTLNVGGTRMVIELGLPTVYTSSSITCGFGTLAAPGDEDDPSEEPAHPIRGTGRVYRETKLEAEARVADAGGFVVNPDYVVGPGDVGGVVTGPLLQAARLPVIVAPRGGKCFVGVEDVGRGHLLALRHGRPGRRYLLGAENRPYADVIVTLARMMGRRPPVLPFPRRLARALTQVPPLARVAGAAEQMGLERYRSGARARSELGWTPAPVDQALAAMVAELSG